MAAFFRDNLGQKEHYRRMVNGRRPTKNLFSCGYYERFDPFIFEQKPFLRSVYDDIFKEWFPSRVDSILDIGCGTCLYWPVLKNYSRSITGVDSSAEMLSAASGLIRKMGWDSVKLVQYDGYRLDFPEGSFDAIVCVDLLHHVSHLEQMLPQIFYLLKPGGRLFILEPNALNPLIFVAHLIPAEERRAITRNFAFKFRRLLSPYFQDIQIRYDFLIMSVSSESGLRMVRKIGRLLTAFFPPFRYLGFRMMLSMRKPNNIKKYAD